MPLFPFSQIQKICSSTIYKRGEKYSTNERVSHPKFEKNGDTITCTATLHGTDDYKTTLKWDQKKGVLRSYHCNCPYDWGDMCKHEVGLAMYLHTLEKKRVLQEYLIPDKKDWKREDIEIEFLRFEKVNLLFRFFDSENHQIFDIDIVPEKWKKTLSSQEKNLLSFFEKNYHPESEGEFSILPNDPIVYDQLFSLLQSGVRVIDKSTNHPLTFSHELFPPEWEIEEFDMDEDLLRYRLKEGKIIPQFPEKPCWLYQYGVFSPLTPIPKDISHIPEIFIDFFEQMVNTEAAEYSLNGIDEIENQLLPEVEKWSGAPLPLPNIPPIDESLSYDLHIYIKKEKEFYRDQIEVGFFFECGKRNYPILKALYDTQENDFKEMMMEQMRGKKMSVLERNIFEDFLGERMTISSSIEQFTPGDPLHHSRTKGEKKYLLFEGQYFENPVYIPRNIALEEELKAFLEKQEQKGMRIGNTLVFEFPSQELKTFGNALHKTAKKHNWNLHFSEGITSLSFKKKNVEFDFDIQMSDSGLLDFDLNIHLQKQNLNEKQLDELLESLDRGEFFESGGEYFEVGNTEEVKKLLNFTQKIKKKKDGRYESPLWNMTELEGFFDSKAFSVKREDRYDTFVKEAKSGKPVKSIPMPKKVKSILRTYQKRGVNWMYFLRKYHFGGILGDDMGLGKTLQTLTYLKSLKAKQPHLIICPKTLLFNWQNEVEKFFPETKILTISGPTKERRAQIKEKTLKKYDLVLTSYSLLQQDIDYWHTLNTPFDTMIIDEAQHIKNHKTKTAKAAKLVPTNHRIALTGTPLENGVSEIWSIYDYLMPGFLGNYEHFRTDFENPIMKRGNGKMLEILGNRVKPFLLRREKKEILKELPAKIEQNSYCELEKEQMLLYTKILMQVRENVLNTVKTKGFEKSRIEILAALTKLRQICNHPGQIDQNLLHAKSGKIEQCMELLSDAMEGDHKVLIFSSFVKTLRILKTRLEKEKIDFSYLDGQTKDRKSEIESFSNNSEKRVFLISLKAGGTGLNLTSADTVFLFDPWWNPMVEMQAMDRAHRIGQKSTVNVYSLITKNTIEEKMLTIKERKKKLFDGVVGKSDQFIQKLSWEDLKGLFD